MSVIAKFRCDSVLKTTSGEEVHLVAVGSDDVNKSWSEYTPSGNLKMHITNKDACGQFVPGKTYSITLEEFNG